MTETIKTSVMTVQANVRWFCATCACHRAVWVAETWEGDTIVGCGTCQLILKRQRTDSIPPLSVNAGS